MIRNFFCCFLRKTNKAEQVDTLKKKCYCKICGEELERIKENKYIIQENKGMYGITTGTKKFECFDCPHCGCQNILNIREG